MKLGVYIQYQGLNISRDEIINLIFEKVGYNISNIQIYYQPENSMIYYQVEKDGKTEYGKLEFGISDKSIDEDYDRILYEIKLPKDIIPQKSINRRRFNLTFDHKSFATISYDENFYNIRTRKSLLDLIERNYEFQEGHGANTAYIKNIPYKDTELLNSIIAIVKTGYKYDGNYEKQKRKFIDDINKLSDSQLYAIAKARNKGNKKREVKSYQTYDRDPIIAEYTLRRAKGICQLCGSKAPFVKKDGTPYLESHHIIWLSNDGEDSIENTVALCPNCHKKMHILNLKEDVDFLIKQNSKTNKLYEMDVANGATEIKNAEEF